MNKMSIDNEKCCECGSCAYVCRQHGIDYDFKTGKYVIDQRRCIYCGTCKEYCPIDGALFEVAVAQVTAAA